MEDKDKFEKYRQTQQELVIVRNRYIRKVELSYDDDGNQCLLIQFAGDPGKISVSNSTNETIELKRVSPVLHKRPVHYW